MRLKYFEVEGSCFVDDIMILTIALIPLFSVVYLIGKSGRASLEDSFVRGKVKGKRAKLPDYTCFALYPSEQLENSSIIGYIPIPV